MRRAGRSWWSRASLGFAAALALAAAAPSLAQAISITEFSKGLNSNLNGPIAEAPDGSMWFTEEHSLGRITSSGEISEITTSNGLKSGSAPVDITLGSDGNLWFTDNGTTKAIGRVTPAGVVTEFTNLLNPGSVPQDVTLGPGGNVWFADLGTPRAIGRVTTAGKIDEFSSGLPTNARMESPTEGPDGNLWFTEEGDTRGIGRVKPNGEIQVFTRLVEPMQSFPADIAPGPDGNLWFSDDGEPTGIGRVTPTGTITEFGEGSGLQMHGAPDAVTEGPDGNMWFTDQLNTQRAVGRITSAGTITEFTKGLGTGLPDDITVGADGNLWIEQSMPGGIARITTAGTITQFTAGLNPEAGADGDAIVPGPGDTLWFTDRGTPNAIGRVSLELPHPAPEPGKSTTSTTTGPTPGVVPIAAPAPTSTTATVGDQRIVVTTPALSLCTASTKTLPVTFSSSALSGSHATKLRFASAAFFVDRGVKRKLVKRVHGKKKTVTVYMPNATLRHVMGSLSLRLTGVSSGLHTLKVIVTYKKAVAAGHAKRTVSVTKTLVAKFRVC